MSYQDTQSKELVLALESNYNNPHLKKGKVKKTFHTVFDSEIVLTGWKFNEWDYGKLNRIQLPTQLRGLFTLGEKILVRGYDKFFNVGEVATTKWDYILNNTTGPYDLTLKQNGCIIFIAGLESGELVVCSKHSTGYRDDVQRNHAEYGYKMLLDQLNKLNITPSELAHTLYLENLTAVLELCDDDFEEHVLRYTTEDSGLYLHGLNLNTPLFKTLPMEDVTKFANQFGFKTIDYITNNDVHSLKAFLEECAKTGTFMGQEVEGFVIRCKLSPSHDDFFFKFKFEEPYLMYRQWREVTKDLIKGKSVSELRISKHKLQTLKYIEFILPILKEDEKLRDDYLAGHGIIELRDRYLTSVGKKGFEIAALTREDDEDDPALIARKLHDLSLENLSVQEKKCKYVIIPVATIGCGKTTVALLLKYLFESWTHIQNDDIPNPVKDKLVKGALQLLGDSPCCFVDRNNHQIRERRQLFDEFEKFFSSYPYSSEYQLKFICLNFIQDKYELRDQLWAVTQDRVVKRGDNHQSIKAVDDGVEKIEHIMKGFIGRFQKVDPTRMPDSLFNLIIDLKITGQDSSLTNIKTVVNLIHALYPDLILEVPSDEKIAESFQFALNYRPTITKIFKSQPSQKKKLKPSYFALKFKNPQSLLDKIDDFLLESSNEKLKIMYQSLKQLGRIQDEFHITLTHILSLKIDRAVYSNYTKKFYADQIVEFTQSGDESMSLPFENCEVKLQKFCFTKDLLCIQVQCSLQLPNQEPSDKWCSNRYPHITLGTVDESVPARMSNDVLESINDFLDSEDKGFFECPVDDDIVFDGQDLELEMHR